MSPIFFRKNLQNFRKISWNFVNLFKIEKNLYFCTRISQKSLYWSKFGQIFPWNSKKQPFSIKISYFSNFSAPKIWSFKSQKPDFLEFGSPLRPWSPPKIPLASILFLIEKVLIWLTLYSNTWWSTKFAVDCNWLQVYCWKILKFFSNFCSIQLGKN